MTRACARGARPEAVLHVGIAGARGSSRPRSCSVGVRLLRRDRSGVHDAARRAGRTGRSAARGLRAGAAGGARARRSRRAARSAAAQGTRSRRWRASACSAPRRLRAFRGRAAGDLERRRRAWTGRGGGSTTRLVRLRPRSNVSSRSFPPSTLPPWRDCRTRARPARPAARRRRAAHGRSARRGVDRRVRRPVLRRRVGIGPALIPS